MSWQFCEGLFETAEEKRTIVSRILEGAGDDEIIRGLLFGEQRKPEA